MWIRTQNNQRVINSNQIVDIFIDRTGTIIYAETTRDGDFIELGTYKDRDTCLDILTTLHTAIGSGVPIINMPLGGNVDEWREIVNDISDKYAKMQVLRVCK